MVDVERLRAFGNFIGNELSVKEIDIKNLLTHIDTCHPCSSINCSFFLIKSDSTKVREKDFLRYVKRKVVPYTLKKSQYQNHSYDDIIDIAQKAINKFNSTESSGELGELILYFLLEGFEGAIQVVNKMGLKTSPNVNYHGLDSIHFGIKEGSPAIYYGESKMHKRNRKAAQEALDTFKKFYSIPKKEKFELDLVSSHIDESKFGVYKEDLYNFLDPYYPDKESMKTIHAIFLGYDWTKLNIEFWDRDEPLNDYLRSEYKRSVNKISKIIMDEVKKRSEIKNYHFKVYLIPFSDIEKARSTFRRLLNNEE